MKRIDPGPKSVPETPLECFAAALPFLVVLALCIAGVALGW
jgi:hypothetical protein